MTGASKKTFTEYQIEAQETAIYPSAAAVVYPAMLLASEAGEVAGKVQKLIRQGRDLTTLTYEERQAIAAEAGDCLWAIAALLNDMCLGMGTTAINNLNKLADRQQRGVLEGSGDNR